MTTRTSQEATPFQRQLNFVDGGQPMAGQIGKPAPNPGVRNFVLTLGYDPFAHGDTKEAMRRGLPCPCSDTGL